MKMRYRGTMGNLLTMLIVSVSLFVTFLSINNASYGIECILLTLVVLVLNFKSKNLLYMLPSMLVCCVVMCVFAFSGQMSVRGFNAPVNHMLKFVYLTFSAALSVGMRELSKEHRTAVVRFSLLAVIISAAISTFVVIFVDRYAIRYPAERGFWYVLDFAQFYGCCFILCSLVFAILSFRQKYSAFWLLVVSALLGICVIVSLYTTGVLLTGLGIGMGCAIYKYQQSKTKAFLWAGMFFVVLVVIAVFGNQVSDLIYKSTESLNWIVRDRLRSVADTIFGTNHNLSYSYDRRDELAGYSLTTFKKNPFFGIGYSTYGYGVIGGHQEWQDMLGVFGVCGSLIFVVVILFYAKTTMRQTETKTDKYAFGIAFIMFVIFGFLNPCLNLPVLTAVFVISPNISLLFPWWKDSRMV